MSLLLLQEGAGSVALKELFEVVPVMVKPRAKGVWGLVCEGRRRAPERVCFPQHRPSLVDSGPIYDDGRWVDLFASQGLCPG